LPISRTGSPGWLCFLTDGDRKKIRCSVRLLCYRLLANEFATNPILARKAATDESVLVRSWLAGKLRSIVPDEGTSILIELLSDRSATVRAAALGAISVDLPDRAREIVLELAHDSSPSVRQEAVRVLRQNYRVDVAALYRARAREPDVASPGTIAGLGWLGDASDVPALKPFTQHRRAAMRAAGLASLARLAPEVARHHAVRLLSDPSGRVRRVAVTLLGASTRQEDFPQILGVLREGHLKAKGAALGVIAKRGGWQALPAFLSAIMSEEEAVVQRGWSLLASWYWRSATLWEKPPREILVEAEGYLQAIGDRRLPVPEGARHAWKELEWYLQQRGTNVGYFTGEDPQGNSPLG
jgi:HEAT repeat protein